MPKLSKLPFNLLFLFWFLVLSGCFMGEGMPGVSKDSKESKRRGVFVKKGSLSFVGEELNQQEKWRIEEVWIEKSWVYGSSHELTRPSSRPKGKFQLKINFQDTIKLGTNMFDWRIYAPKNDGKEFDLRTAGETALMGNLDEIPEGELDFQLARYERINGNSTMVKNVPIFRIRF